MVYKRDLRLVNMDYFDHINWNLTFIFLLEIHQKQILGNTQSAKKCCYLCKVWPLTKTNNFHSFYKNDLLYFFRILLLLNEEIKIQKSLQSLTIDYFVCAVSQDWELQSWNKICHFWKLKYLTSSKFVLSLNYEIKILKSLVVYNFLSLIKKKINDKSRILITHFIEK